MVLLVKLVILFALVELFILVQKHPRGEMQLILDVLQQINMCRQKAWQKV